MDYKQIINHPEAVYVANSIKKHLEENQTVPVHFLTRNNSTYKTIGLARFVVDYLTENPNERVNLLFNSISQMENTQDRLSEEHLSKCYFILNGEYYHPDPTPRILLCDDPHMMDVNWFKQIILPAIQSGVYKHFVGLGWCIPYGELLDMFGSNYTTLKL